MQSTGKSSEEIFCSPAIQEGADQMREDRKKIEETNEHNQTLDLQESEHEENDSVMLSLQDLLDRKDSRKKEIKENDLVTPSLQDLMDLEDGKRNSVLTTEKQNEPSYKFFHVRLESMKNKKPNLKNFSAKTDPENPSDD